MEGGNFPIQMQMYDAKKTESDINDLDAELHDEHQLEANLGADSGHKVAEAIQFIVENKDTILDQHARLMVLNQQLRVVVKSNKEKQAADEEYNTLANSEEYQLLGSKMGEIRAMIDSLREFLIQEGVRGRI